MSPSTTSSFIPARFRSSVPSGTASRRPRSRRAWRGPWRRAGGCGSGTSRRRDSPRHGDVETIAVGDLERVRPPRRDAVPVPREHEHVMTVQVHRVRDVRVVREAELDRLAAAQHVHRHARKRLPVDRPLPAEVHASLEEAEASPEVDFEVSVEVRRDRCRRRAVRRRIEVRPNRASEVRPRPDRVPARRPGREQRDAPARSASGTPGRSGRPPGRRSSRRRAADRQACRVRRSR